MFIVTVLYSLGCMCNHVLTDCPITDRKSNFNEQLRLQKSLFKNYCPRLPAVAVQSPNITFNDEVPRFEVLLTLSQIKLTQMVEKQHKAEFLLDYFVDWRDERLKWNPESYCGLDHIYVPSSKIWIPDIIFVDVHSFKNYRNSEDDFVRLNSSGHVRFFILTRTATVCPVDIQDFPFDQQDCTVNLTSLPFSYDEYDIKLALEPFLLTELNNMGNEEWRINNVTSMTYPPGYEDHEICTIFISMKRSPSLYITMVITPPFVVNILSIFGVFMKSAESMGKIGTALTNIISLTFVFGILATELPKTQKLPKIENLQIGQNLNNLVYGAIVFSIPLIQTFLVVFVLGNLLIMLLALATTYVLPYLKQFLSRYTKSDKRRVDELYRKVAYMLCMVFEIANLINLVVLMT